MGNTPGLHGVGFIVKKYLKNYITSFIGLSERVAILNLSFNKFKLSIIQVYAPTEAAPDDDVIKFYETVNSALARSETNVMVIGDFNAKIGKAKPGENLIMNKHTYGTRSKRGEMLIAFAFENNLPILNTFFKKKEKQKWTWRSPDGSTRNEIDFILSNLKNSTSNIEIIDLPFSSDHRLVRATLKLKIPKKSRRNFNKVPKSLLLQDEEVTRYIEHLNTQNIMSLEYEVDTIQILYNKIIHAVTSSQTLARLPSSHFKNEIIQDRTMRLLERKYELQKTKPKTRAMKNELSALYKLVSKYLKTDYKEHRYNTIQKHIASTGSLKKAYKELNTHKTWIESLQNSTNVTQNRREIIKIASTFYKDLYSEKRINTSTDMYDTSSCSVETSSHIPFDEIEVLNAIKRLKNDKTPGSDNISNEAIKTAGHCLAGPLTKLFNRILQTGITPSQWTECTIILLYKKGNPRNIANYRPISLLSCLYKLFASLIEKRIKEVIEFNQPVEQAGFRSGFSTIDNIHSIELLIEKFQEYRKPLYIAFIDYQKAFDCVKHEAIWKCLQKLNIAQEYITILRYLYENSTSKIRLESTGPPIPIQRGVKQGDPLSPKMFITVLESALSTLKWDKLGIYINGKYFNHLRFADDIAVFSENSAQMQFMLDTLSKASREVGLEINFSKSKLMTNSAETPIMIENANIEYVQKYIYLGKQISFDCTNNEDEIDRRIKFAWNKYWSLKEILKSKMPMYLKRKIMNTCILPTLTYGCQTWKFTSKARKMITSCQRAMERSILKIRKIHKIRHAIIRQQTKLTDALAFSLKSKWKWAGHVARLTDNRWTIKLTSWPGPKGTRSRGRPHYRWDDDIKRVAGPNWMWSAKDRAKWASLEEAFT